MKKATITGGSRLNSPWCPNYFIFIGISGKMKVKWSNRTPLRTLNSQSQNPGSAPNYGTETYGFVSLEPLSCTFICFSVITAMFLHNGITFMISYDFNHAFFMITMHLFLQVLPIYMHIRVLVSCYLFLSGYGHFTYFWKKGEYGLFRYCQVSVTLLSFWCRD